MIVRWSSPKLWIAVGGFGLLVLGIFAILRWVLPRQYLVIADQNREVTLTIAKVYFPRGGFLVMDKAGHKDPAEIGEAQGRGLTQTTYLPAGEYKNISLSYVSTPLDTYPASSYEIRAVVYEDKNNNHKLDEADRTMRDILGRTIKKRFVLFQKSTPAVSCQKGFSDAFGGTDIDPTRWAKSAQVSANNGLFQRAQYNGPDGGATTLYTKGKFSGDMAIEMEITAYQVEQEKTTGFAGRLEFIMETGHDRVMSVKWLKNEGGSYLVPALSFTTNIAPAPHPVNAPFPVRLRLVRRGGSGELWIDEGQGFTRLWEFPVSADDVYIGLLTADEGEAPQVVTSQVANISISCP